MLIKSVLKNAFIKIKNSKKSFISLIFILILGTSVCVSLNLISSNMKSASKKYYDDTNFMDLKLVSTMGFSSDDLIKIKELKEVKGISLIKSLSTNASINDNDYTIKVNSINKDRSKKNNDYINRLILTSGRYPSTINEGLVEEKLLKEHNIKLGDLITLMPDNSNDLRAKKIKIVGTVKSSYHSPNGNLLDSKNSKIDYYIYVEENDFNVNYYTEGYVTFKNKKNYDTYSKEYNDYIDNNKTEILNIISESTNSKYNYTVSDLKSSIENLESSLTLLYSSDVPQELLNESIKELSNELNDAKNSLKSIPEPKSYTLRRNETQSFYEYELEIKKISSISKVFSKFFIVVMSLSSLFIIYKFINNERKEIGALRATGYNRLEVSFKYVLYTLLAGSMGCVLGSFLFSKVISKIIFMCYKSSYKIPSVINCTQFKYSAKLCILEVFLLLVMTCAILIKYSIENPSELMSEKKKISKLNSVLRKFRIINKKDFLTKTILSSLMFSLILTMLSFKASISSTINNEYNKINKYDISLHINSNITKEDLGVLESKLAKNKNVIRISKVNEANTYVKKKNASGDLTLIIPSDGKKLSSFIKLSDTKGKNLKLNDNGIIISNKVANTLNVKKNDNIKIAIDEKEYKVKVSDISLNYINSYAYISNSLYKKLTENDVLYNTVLICVKDNNNKKKLNSIINEVKEDSNVIFYTLTDDVKDMYKNDIKPLNNVIFVLIIIVIIFMFCAMKYILNENKKEYLIKKSLGTYDLEIIKDMLKEYVIITFICSIIGTIFGSILTNFIINSCETNIFSFKLSIGFLTYILSFLVTFCIITILSILLHINFRKISIIDELNNINQ